MEGLRAGVAGVLRHRGGWHYLPAEDDEIVRLRHVPNGEKCMDITVCDNGDFAVLYGGDEPVYGTLQAPSDKAADEWTVRRTYERPTYPVLMNAIDLPVNEVSVTDSSLSFTCGDTVYTPVQITAPTKPTVSVNGIVVSGEWNEETKTLWIDRLWMSGEKIVATV